MPSMCPSLYVWCSICFLANLVVLAMVLLRFWKARRFLMSNAQLVSSFISLTGRMLILRRHSGSQLKISRHLPSFVSFTSTQTQIHVFLLTSCGCYCIQLLQASSFLLLSDVFPPSEASFSVSLEHVPAGHWPLKGWQLVSPTNVCKSYCI